MFFLFLIIYVFFFLGLKLLVDFRLGVVLIYILKYGLVIIYVILIFFSLFLMYFCILSFNWWGFLLGFLLLCLILVLYLFGKNYWIVLDFLVRCSSLIWCWRFLCLIVEMIVFVWEDWYVDLMLVDEVRLLIMIERLFDFYFVIWDVFFLVVLGEVKSVIWGNGGWVWSRDVVM